MTDAASPDKSAVLAALDAVRDPKTGRGLAAAGLVQGLTVQNGRAGFMLEVPRGDSALYADVRVAAERAMAAVPGVEKAQVVLTTIAGPPRGAHTHSHARAAAPAPAPRKAARVSNDPGAVPGPSAEAARPAHVKRVIAVASGKGGVGKSTVAVNLAAAFARLGLRAGLLDADVYGPSAPRMLGVEGEPAFGPDKKIVPLQAHGLKVMSIGFLVGEGQAMIWRGPMASSAVRQMAHDVAWGTAEEPLDVLVIDLPPGTGDIQLTLVQKIALDGVVVVSTPQEVALIDVRRAVEMFRKTGAPILGVVENMAYFPDPSTGRPIPIFGRGGAAAEASKLGVPLLAEVPIDIALREAGDNGQPLPSVDPDQTNAKVFLNLARSLAA